MKSIRVSEGFTSLELMSVSLWGNMVHMAHGVCTRSHSSHSTWVYALILTHSTCAHTRVQQHTAVHTVTHTHQHTGVHTHTQHGGAHSHSYGTRMCTHTHTYSHTVYAAGSSTSAPPGLGTLTPGAGLPLCGEWMNRGWRSCERVLSLAT